MTGFRIVVFDPGSPEEDELSTVMRLEATTLPTAGPRWSPRITRRGRPTTDRMTPHEMTSLRIGDVVTSTDVLESYPTYWIDPGARFVVVANTFADERFGVLGLRLVPTDAALMAAGDLSERGGAVEVRDPVTSGTDHESGADPHDRAAQGNAWSSATVPVRATPDALTLPERVAAVFAQRLFEQVDHEGIREVARRNAAETDPRMCHSHDLCDANMPMLAAFKTMSLPDHVVFSIRNITTQMRRR